MALRTDDSSESEPKAWIDLFSTKLGMQLETARKYAHVLSNDGYCMETMKHLLSHSMPGVPCTTLLELGIKAGHCLKMALYFNPERSNNESSDTNNSPIKIKIPRPLLSLDINQVDFDQFKYEWNTYRTHYHIKQKDVASQLFYCGNEDVRKRVRLEQPCFTTPGKYTESELLNFLKDIVLSKVSRIVQIKQFHDLLQKPSELCNEYVARLQAKASCCGFVCKLCSGDLTLERVKEQFVVGLSNKLIQTAILKTESVKPDTPLKCLLSEAITLEQSMKDQVTLKGTDNILSMDSEVDQVDEDEVQAFSKSFYPKRGQKAQPCSGCGTFNHKSTERQARCPAWGRKCHNCGTANHFKSCCRTKKERRTDTPNRSTQLLDMTCMSMEVSKSLLITVHVQPLLKGVKACKPMLVFPDTGANICLIGPTQLKLLGIHLNQIYSGTFNISVAGGSSIKAIGSFNTKLTLGDRVTSQNVFFSKSADRFFLSRQACIALGIVPPSFPHPPIDSIESKTLMSVLSDMNDRSVPDRPKELPFAPIEENVAKLKEYLLLQFANSAFNRTEPFPKLSTPPATIHLKPDHIIPKPAYWPATVAEHWAEEVRASIEKDVRAGVLVKVPFNEPTVWCSRMVLVKKKDGRPRRTVDYQRLNQQCLREPNYGEPPFHTARRVPLNSWKSTFDAVDGYHSVELDEASSKLTTFITPWGRYRYLRFPQGHCSAGDAFNGRIQYIVSKIPRLVRIVDDICVHDDTIEGAFWHAWEVLTTCASNGIVVNEAKFQFCLKEVQFAGLSITPRGIQPSPKLLNAIENFPPPTDISKARGFFGLVNQVQWAYANSSEMTPFRSMVQPNAVYTWTEEMKGLFEKCKQKIISQVKEGVQNYSIDRVTCLQTDFCKDGLGYLLLQKHCDCSIDLAPLCCRTGWKIVFAGSRFTKGAESRYAPTEGEALAVAWALNHAHLFTKGCKKLIVSTDHQPLLGIFNDKPLESIANPRIVRLKEQTLSFHFSASTTKESGTGHPTLFLEVLSHHLYWLNYCVCLINRIQHKMNLFLIVKQNLLLLSWIWMVRYHLMMCEKHLRLILSLKHLP